MPDFLKSLLYGCLYIDAAKAIKTTHVNKSSNKRLILVFIYYGTAPAFDLAYEHGLSNEVHLEFLSKKGKVKMYE